MSNSIIFVVGIWGFASGWVASRPHHYKTLLKILEDELAQEGLKVTRTSSPGTTHLEKLAAEAREDYRQGRTEPL